MKVMGIADNLRERGKFSISENHLPHSVDTAVLELTILWLSVVQWDLILKMEMSYFCTNTVVTSHMWLLSTYMCGQCDWKIEV